MLSVFSENIGSIAVLLALALIIGLVAFKVIRDKKRGKSSCGCGCGSCPMSKECHSKKNDK